MATTAMTRKMEAIEARARSAMSRARVRAQQAASAQKHTLIAAGVGYAMGAAEKRGLSLPTVDGIDPKLLYGGVALAGAYMLKDKSLQQIAQSTADGLLSICAYKLGKDEPIFGAGAGG